MSIIVLKDEYKITRTMLKNWYKLHRLRVFYRRKINKIYNKVVKQQTYSNVQLDINKYKKKWSTINKHVNPYWYKTYSYISGIEDINYVPEDLFYGIIEPTLNNLSVAATYTDKNFYNKLYSDLNIFPETIFRNMEGVFYDSNYEYLDNIKYIEDYLEDEQKVIVKPALESGGGRNVQIFYKKNDNYFNKSGKMLSINYLKNNYKKDFLIQKCIEPANYFKQFNDTSLNTMRICTYRSVKTNEVFIINWNLKIGKKGSEMDNLSSGGICCLVDKNGKLSSFATDVNGNKYFNLPWNPDLKFSEAENIPKFEEIKRFAKEIAKRNYYQRILGLDICIDNKDNIKLVEINNDECGINMFQMLGTSLFNDYTDEVIEYCSDKTKRRTRNMR